MKNLKTFIKTTIFVLTLLIINYNVTLAMDKEEDDFVANHVKQARERQAKKPNIDTIILVQAERSKAEYERHKWEEEKEALTNAFNKVTIAQDDKMKRAEAEHKQESQRKEDQKKAAEINHQQQMEIQKDREQQRVQTVMASTATFVTMVHKIAEDNLFTAGDLPAAAVATIALVPLIKAVVDYSGSSPGTKKKD